MPLLTNHSDLLVSICCKACASRLVTVGDMTSDLHKDLSDDTETRQATILDYCHRAFIIVVLKNQAMA